MKPGDPSQPIAIAIHGGAGAMLSGNSTRRKQQEHLDTLAASVKAGFSILTEGQSSVDAVVAAIRVLEDSPLFNAGKGSVFTQDGRNELDASIMDGRDLSAGAVSNLRHIRNPIELARLVMTDSEHVMLSGEGAEAFAQERGVKFVPADYFFTAARYEQFQRHRGDLGEKRFLSEDDDKFGTVGAVALDFSGNVAAGTSTGGIVNKRFGRVGDSPIIGAGTYADNNSCAVSATGHGEYFIRAAVTHDICARVEYSGIGLQQAADEVIKGKLHKMGGGGGVVGIDKSGNIVFSFNTTGMYRASIDCKAQLQTSIFK